MAEMGYHSTNNRAERVNFEEALLTGQPKDYGFYMIARADVPKLRPDRLKASYSPIVIPQFFAFSKESLPGAESMHKAP